jgi:hypothetical protein
MKSWTSRCLQIGSKAIRRVNGWKVLAWVLASLALTQIAQALSGYALSVGISGWFLVIPAEPLFEGMVVCGGLLCLLHRWIVAFPKTFYVLTIRNTQVSSPWVILSFSPFSASYIQQMEKELFELDCQLWGEEALWEYGEAERSIAYVNNTAKFTVSPAPWYRGIRKQRSAKP